MIHKKPTHPTNNPAQASYQRAAFTPLNENLYDAAWRFVMSAADLVRRTVSLASLVEFLHQFCRKPDEGRAWQSDPLQLLLINLQPRLCMLPDFEAFQQEIRRDESVSRFTNTFVSVLGSGRRFTEPDIILPFLTRMQLTLPHCTVDRARYDLTYQEFEQSCNATQVSIERIAPICHLSTELPIHVSSTLVIQDITGTEYHDLVGHVLPSSLHRCFSRPTTAIIQKFTAAYRIGEPDSSLGDELDVAEDDLRAVRRALCIYTTGIPATVGVLTRHTWWFQLAPSVMWDILDTASPLPRCCRLTSGDEYALPRFWSQFRSPRVTELRWLQVAIHWFEKGVFDRAADDRILSFMIAAEALLLQSDKTSGELSFRLCVRAAQLHLHCGDDHGRAFELYQEAYRVRSKLVHGSELKEDACVYNDLSVRLESSLRLCLRRVIEAVASNSPSPVGDWNTALLRSLHRDSSTSSVEG